MKKPKESTPILVSRHESSLNTEQRGVGIGPGTDL